MSIRHRNPWRQGSLRRKQAGQALTEFLVVALAIIPLFLMMPVIAKYQDIAHATQLASRYTAFDATINNPSTNGTKPPAALAQEVRRRFFSNSESAVKTNDSAGNFRAHQNLFWRGPSGASLIGDIDEIDVNLSLTGASGSQLLADYASAFGLPEHPMHRGQVTVPLVNLPAGIRSYEPFDQLNLSMTRATSLLVNGWGARDLDATRSQVRRMAPVTDALEVADSLLILPFAVVELGQVDQPRIGELQLWDDVVPRDRLRTP